jgi:hypothetical protein
MNKQEIRTLRGQLVLMAILFVGSLALAVFMAVNRSFFEKYIEEKYGAMPASAQPLAERAETGRFDESDKEKFAGLSDSERLALYDDWMSREESSAGTPRALIDVAASLYITRAERTIVCGSEDQKRRALRFLELSRSREAIPVLRKAHRWAVRRGSEELAARIADALRRLGDTL